jgi:hypothetical protein
MTSRYIVVYQMGKVASTSIVATLTERDGIEAVQSHFLGEKALAALIPSITNADVPQYFFKNQFGQFFENVRTTRRINRIRAGLIPTERLLVISLSRNPIEWARSSVVQDVEGYLAIFKNICKTQSLSSETEEEAVTSGLKYILNASCKLLEKMGGIDAFLANTASYSAKFRNTIFEENPGSARLFMMLLRPAEWFEKHFEVALGVNLKGMEKNANIWTASSPNADYVIVRYEEMAVALPRWLQDNGICTISKLKRENESGEKKFAKEVADVFKSAAGRRFNKIYADTQYCRNFHYSAS